MTPLLKSSKRCRGTIFIAALILLVGMSVAILSLVSEVSLDLRMGSNLAETDQAMEIAKIGIDSVIYMAQQNSNWRQAYGSGVWISNRPVCGGTLTVSVTDPDGNIADFPIDPVIVRSTGRYKGASFTLSATIRPPVHGSMNYVASTLSTGDSARMYIVNGPRIYGSLYAQVSVEYMGDLPDLRGDIHTSYPSQVPAALLDANTTAVLVSPRLSSLTVNTEWFVNRGSILTPPLDGGVYQVSDKIISPSSNPYGFANAEGIYVVNNGTLPVKFTGCYITGTIIVTGSGAVTFDKAVVHAPALPCYPALVAAHTVYYQFDSSLSESTSNVDFNGDGDKLDAFTPSVSGIAYAEHTIHVLQYTQSASVCLFRGAVISRNVYLSGAGALFEQDPNLATTLVNQFQGAGLRIVPGSLKIE